MKAVLPLTVGPAGTTEAPGVGGSTPPVPTLVPMGPRWESGGHRVEMVCVSPGPADVHFVWEKNGRELEMCVPMQTHALPDGRAHVLSWLRDAIRESAEYRCSVLSSAGNGTSKVRVTVVRHGERPAPAPTALPAPTAGVLVPWRPAGGRSVWPVPGQPPRHWRCFRTHLLPPVHSLARLGRWS